jgi:Iap family predicted aminopeptidase
MPDVGTGSVAVEELRESALKQSRAHQWVQELTDATGPRMAGSPGDAAGVAWAMAKMKALGFEQVHAEKVSVMHWTRGVETGEVLSPTHHRLALTALGGSVPTPPGGVEAEVIEVTSIEDLQHRSRAQVEGKIVFFSAAIQTDKDYGRLNPIRGNGAVESAKLGAIGMVMRSLATSKARFPHTGMMRYQEGVAKIPAAALAVPDAELLQRLAANPPLRIRYILGCAELPNAESANVIGEVRGREAPTEIVLLGAHLDSWDLGTGALDDGAGVGAVIEVARLISLARPHPRRTIRVVLFANEEHGLEGAKAYAAEHSSELALHALGLELDSGTERVYGMTYLAGANAPSIIEEIARPLLVLGIPKPVEAQHHGADLIPLRQAGVPMAHLQQDGTHYFDFHHTADDTFDKIQPAALAQVVAATAVVAYGAAEAGSRLEPIPESQRGLPK